MKYCVKFGVCLSTAVLVGLSLAGCGGSTSSTVSAPGPSAALVLADGLTLTLTQDTAQAPVGGAVNFQVNLTNRTSAPITSTYLGFGSVYTFYGTGCVVQDPTGMIISTDGAVFTPPPTPPPSPVTVTLQPGQTLPLAQRYTFTRAGTYTARAVLQLPSPSFASVQTAPLIVTVR